MDDVSLYAKDRPCTRCGEMPTEEGHDACIANLPGVRNACCGHGVEEGYIQFFAEDGVSAGKVVYLSKRKPKG